MTLSTGTRLGPYEIVAMLGVGGMGEVYRATDTRLERFVAVKVLPPQWSSSAQLRSRFEREARVIASLQHPHICTLHDVGREGETDYLVMELLEGEPLDRRLARGRLTMDEVLRFGAQIAGALETAHRAGIVHRDLKPGNVFVTDHGVKLLDFGLAMLQVAEPDLTATDRAGASTEDGMNGLTTEGAILGTFQYMAPEQLAGRKADPRTDIFALGAVLHEMATGSRAFDGESRAELIAAILQLLPPPVSSLAPGASPALDRVVATCLAKDPGDRWQAAHDVRLQLAWIAETGAPGAVAPLAPSRARRPLVAWAVVAAMVAAALVGAFFVFAPAPPAVGTLVRFEVPQPGGASLAGAPKLSPDGRVLAFDAVDEQGTRRIWVRAMGALAARPLRGTEGTASPFWSPDSRSLGFVAQGKLRKVSLAGGPPQTLCDASVWGGDGTWSEDGTILFDGAGRPIRRVSASGGEPAPLAGIGKVDVGWPQLLPGGRRLLYAELASGGRLAIRIANADGSDPREVMTATSQVQYAPPGYLLFVREGTLVAQRFDPTAGRLAGDPIPLAEGMATDSFGGVDFSVSRNGVLAYRAGERGDSQYVWIDRQGHRRAAAQGAQNDGNFDLSPDGRWLAYEEFGPQGVDLWLRDLRRGTASRWTEDPGDEMCPLFTADGSELLFERNDGKRARLVARPLDGGGVERVLGEDSTFLCPEALGPDGKVLLFDRAKGGDTYDIWKLDTGRPGSAAPLVATAHSSSRPAISPDGRWVAFQGNDSGRDEIYVVALAGGGARWQISTRGGREPQWGADGAELFFVSPESRLMRVGVQTGARFDAGGSEPLFALAVSPVLGRNRYVMATDGSRFMVQVPQGDRQPAPVTLVLNWPQMLPR